MTDETQAQDEQKPSIRIDGTNVMQGDWIVASYMLHEDTRCGVIGRVIKIYEDGDASWIGIDIYKGNGERMKLNRKDVVRLDTIYGPIKTTSDLIEEITGGLVEVHCVDISLSDLLGGGRPKDML